MKSIYSWVILLLLTSAINPTIDFSQKNNHPSYTSPLPENAAIFLGEAVGDLSGRSAAIVGDTNGDGFSDLLIGAYGYSNFTGRAYLFLGGPNGWLLNQGLSGADAVFTGESENSRTGWYVTGAGDINSDGFADFLIGAPAFDNYRGKTYLVLGNPNPISQSLGEAGIISYTGEALGDRSGWSLSSAGDVNGDGFTDLLIGAWGYDNDTGRAHLVLGSLNPSSLSLGDPAIVNYTGSAPGDWAGRSVSGGGDANGDGYSDILISAYHYDNARGRVYLVLGNSNPTTLQLEDVSNIQYTGETVGDRAGMNVANAGDVNGDGYADILIGADGFNSDTGRVYLISGQNNLSSLSLSDLSVIKYTGENPDDQAGWNIGGVGDINSDGYIDIIIGAFAYNSSAGRTYVELGSSTPISKTLSASSIILPAEETSGEEFGFSVSITGDVNGDILSDLLISAAAYDSERGRTFLFFSNFTHPISAQYRLFQQNGIMPPAIVGQSGVIIDYTANAETGYIEVTRHFTDPCNTATPSNGMLWSVENQRGVNAQVKFTFLYNDTQINGWPETILHLWYRDDPCDVWKQDPGAVLEVYTNRITSSPVTNPTREYAIGLTQPGLPVINIYLPSIFKQ